MFMENVDGDHYSLSPILNSSVRSVRVQFLRVDHSGYFQINQILI